ncbi:MAG: hypothetical protein E4G99_10300 [Anaerolineales bacterium]|nr:MAG: hypothetical protein E4G99_10300 [Anaerolineales bacterium]
MTIHTIVLGFFIAMLMGAIAHLLRGGSLRRLGLYILTANLSFFSGHWLGELTHWQLVRVGALNLFPAILASFLGLLLTATLLRQEPTKDPGSQHKRRRDT